MQWSKEKGHTIQWSKIKGHTIQWIKEKGHTIQWSKEKGHTIQWSKEKGHIMIYKTIHRKQNIDNANPLNMFASCLKRRRQKKEKNYHRKSHSTISNSTLTFVMCIF